MMKEAKLIKEVSSNVNPSEFIDMINVKKIHESGITGRGVKIAIIDTGCSKHSLLSGVKISGRNFTSEGLPEDFTDLNGHGTHVAGIISGSHCSGVYGIAPNAELLILKALDKNGGGDIGSVVAAIKFAIDNDVNIINMSLGTQENDSKLVEAVDEAIHKGISVVCASGNSGDDNAQTDECDYPGCYEDVICVGAVGRNYKISSFSNSNKYVDIVAPGEDISSTYINDSIRTLSGTSMATPCISGALALIKEWSLNEFGRELSEMELYGELIKNTKTLDTERSKQGHGVIYLNLLEKGI